jgi:L-asparaginase II
VTQPSDVAPVAITTRSGMDESLHHGAMVGLASSGAVAFAVGNPRAVIYPRSANKPTQATAMVRAGLRLPPRLLALACASHDGAPMHCDGALQILQSAGLDVTALGNTPDLPLDDAAAEDVLRAGGGRSPLLANCSGKHAAMLATCVVNGWPTDGYLRPDHPLQEAITAVVDESLIDDHHRHLGVDGCGAPQHAMTLIGLATSVRAVATGLLGPAGEAVHTAMTQHPEMVGGTRRDVTLLMEGIPHLMAKDGAEGVFAAALPDGRALALKIADGADRARSAVYLAGLAALGISVDHVAPRLTRAILGHGDVVGEVRALWP